MKKITLFCIIFTILAVLLSLNALSVSAAEYPDTLRVGIYYGSGAVSSMTFESSDGFAVGITNDRMFNNIIGLSNTSVTVTKAPVGSHHILYASCSSSEEMTSTLSSMKAQGFDVFPAYCKNSHLILGGSFSSHADAQASIDAAGISASPIALTSNALCLADTASGKILFITDNEGGNISVFNQYPQNPDALLTISGAAKGTYRGGFECTSPNGSTLTVINIVPVESYLYSVVCREMSPGWPIEALKAQAVCARTFALRCTKHKKTYNFDVCPTNCCQVYSSKADMSESIHTAVDGTSGQVLLHNDKLIEAVYSSSAGSATANSKDVWGGDVPYLVSVENSYENTSTIPKGKWSNTITGARATEIMSKYGIGTVTDISAIEYTPEGRVTKLKVTGTNGEKLFERDSCRNAFSEATLSQKYTITKGGTVTYPSAYVLSSTEKTQITLDNISVLSAANAIQKLNGDCIATTGNSIKKYSAVISGGAPDTYTFTGEGWGHGVGMSQYGAKGMAESGIGYEQILSHYYTGTQLETAY